MVSLYCAMDALNAIKDPFDISIVNLKMEPIAEGRSTEDTFKPYYGYGVVGVLIPPIVKHDVSFVLFAT